VVVAVSGARDWERRLLEAWVLDRPAKAVGFVIDRAAAILVKAHCAVALIIVHRDTLPINRRLV